MSSSRARSPFITAAAVLTVLLSLLAQAPASAAVDARRKLVIFAAEPEYDTARTLPIFARKYLEGEFRVVVVSGSMAPGKTAFDHLDELRDADLLLVSVRRRTPPKKQLDIIRDYVKSGKPVVGIRTASHAFALLKDQTLAPGEDAWPEWDAEVLGGHYTNHHGQGPICTISATESANPVLLRGLKIPFTSQATLYKVSPLRDGAHAVLMGTIPGQPAEPVAWTFTHLGGGRTFYTSLGHPTDFEGDSFCRLLQNGIRWAAGLSNQVGTVDGLGSPGRVKSE